MAEYYGRDVLVESRRLYEAIRAWGSTRSGVTLVGGWAVYELVDEAHRMQSRDVDLVLHDAATFRAFDAMLPTWGLAWRTRGRNTFSECVRVGDDTGTILVDVFKGSAYPDTIVRGPRARRGVVTKRVPAQGFVPELSWLLRDKVATVPLRTRDRVSKQTKDLLDIHALLFHNLEGRGARELLATVDPITRLDVARFVPEAIAYRPQNREELEFVHAWLVADTRVDPANGA